MTHLFLKPGVRLHGLSPEMVMAVGVVVGAYEEAGAVECVVTVGMEGSHATSPPSRHYTGDALDFRLHNVDAGARENLVNAVKAHLGGEQSDFTVLWESKGTDNEHLHVQFSPSRPY